jgi:hypothetical protein
VQRTPRLPTLPGACARSFGRDLWHGTLSVAAYAEQIGHVAAWFSTRPSIIP